MTMPTMGPLGASHRLATALARSAPPRIELPLLPRAVPADELECIPDYVDVALASQRPHGPAHDCLICADARAALGISPLEPVLASAARGMRERDAGIARIGTASGGAA